MQKFTMEVKTVPSVGGHANPPLTQLGMVSGHRPKRRRLQRHHATADSTKDCVVTSFTREELPQPQYDEKSHVFVTLGDLRNVSCDMWLMPCASGPHYAENPVWLELLRAQGASNRTSANHGRGDVKWKSERVPVLYNVETRCVVEQKQQQNGSTWSRVAVFKHFPGEDSDYPEPVLLDIDVKGFRSRTQKVYSNGSQIADPPSMAATAAWLCAGVREFLQVVMARLRSRIAREQCTTSTPRNGRERPIVALPVVGTGGGGGWALTGLVVRKLLDTLHEVVGMDNEIDVLLVCRDRPTFAIAQAHRLQAMQKTRNFAFTSTSHSSHSSLSSNQDPVFHPYFAASLSPRLLSVAERLASIAQSGKLALFLGAGVSLGAGQPTWNDLLDGIKQDLVATHALSKWTDVCMDFDKLDPTEKADLLVLMFEDILEQEHGPSFQDVAQCPRIPSYAANDGTHAGDENSLHSTLPTEKRPPTTQSGTPANPLSKHQAGVRALKRAIALRIAKQDKLISLTHSLLAALPTEAVITTNYDQLFEKACASLPHDTLATISADKATSPLDHMRLSVIPYAPRRNHNRWLLKLHGCITHAHDIVITKDDYAAYATDRRHALAGIVQAQLMTNHMLFVGFSCEDSNYKRILGSVIDALTLKVPDTGEESSAVGSDSGATGAADGNNLGPMNGRNSTMGSSGGRDTCGAPPDSPVDQDWSLGTTLQMLPIAEAHCQQPSAYTAGQQVVAMAEATEDFAHSEMDVMGIVGRRQEIFLDYMLALCTSQSSQHLLDDRFVSSLPQGEKALRQQLLSFSKSVTPEMRATAAWQPVQHLLLSLGYGSYKRRERKHRRSAVRWASIQTGTITKH